MYIFNLFGFAWCMRIIKLFGLRIMPTKHDVSAKERSNIISINHTSNLNILLVSELCQPARKLALIFRDVMRSHTHKQQMLKPHLHVASQLTSLTTQNGEHARRLQPPLQMFLGLCQTFLPRVHWGGLRDKPKESRCGRLHRLKVFPPSGYSLSVFQKSMMDTIIHF